MNRKQRRIARSQNKPLIHLYGKIYTIDGAIAVAVKEHSLKNLQAAADIYQFIIAQVPDQADAYNNRGVVLHEMKRYEDALANCDKAIALRSGCAAFHYNRANSLQALQQVDEALASYDKAIAINPDHAEAYNNRGNILQKMKRFNDALADYDKAIAFQPDHVRAHSNRGVVLQELNRHEEARISYDKAIALKPDYIEAYNNRGVTLQKMKRYEESLANCDRAIALKPDCVEAYNNRGATLHEMKRYYDALASYDQAIACNPDCADAYNNRGLTLREMKRPEEALVNYDKAIALKPDYADAHQNRCLILQELKHYNDALASCNKAIELRPDYTDAYQNRGVALMSIGDMQEAEKAFLKVLALQPDYAKALFSLTNIRKYQNVGHADVKTIETLLNKPDASPGGKDYLYFALGKIYDDCGLYDDAFECYRQANEIINAEAAYSPAGVIGFTNSVIDVFSKDFLAQPFAFASDSRSPLFIVGMPRSGTTLMASILSNHRSIDTAGELPTITELTLRLPELMRNNIHYPQAIRHITPAAASRLANDYEKRLRRDTGSDVQHVIDKNPLNFKYLGFISMLFPKARIIHCTRHPMDIGLSNYFRRFALDYSYSFDLRNIGHFYGEYARTMEHWRKVLPTEIIEISYEDMIMNTEFMVRKTLDSLGLEWDERCLAPHTNPCAVETASNWQVRQPIYTQSLERWRHYEKHLTPMKEMLQLAGQYRL